MVVPHPFYFAIPQSGLSQTDPVTAPLRAGVHFATAGAVSLKPGSALQLEPLATTSPQSRAFPAGFALSGAGPEQVLADWPRQDGPTVIGARIRGILPSATAGQPPPPAPDGAPPESGPPLQRSTGPVTIYLFGDADFLYDGLYQGQTGAVADNEALLLNGVDALAGGAQLAQIRSRPVRPGPQTPRTANPQTGEAGFRRELIAARQRLRTLQTATDRQIGMIRTGMIVVCAGLVPAAWLGLGFGLFWRRQRRARLQWESNP